MTAFLSWVFAQAAKVYDWFGNTYYTLKNAAVNAWDWAVSKAQDAYNDAVAYIIGIKQNIYSTIQSNLDWLVSKINDLRSGVIDDLLALYDWLDVKFGQVKGLVTEYVNDALSSLDGLLTSIQNTINALLTNGLNWLWQKVTDTYNWVLVIKSQVLNLLTVVNPAKLQALYLFINTWLNTLTLFFSNPLIFVLDLMQAKFTSFLCYVLAWSLGTTKYELPSKAPWKG